jgi:hypothetical protein
VPVEYYLLCANDNKNEWRAALIIVKANDERITRFNYVRMIVLPLQFDDI